jgi:hypothetical protein
MSKDIGGDHRGANGIHNIIGYFLGFGCIQPGMGELMVGDAMSSSRRELEGSILFP